MIGNYIKAVATAVSRTTAQLMKTGQTVSYRTGDDGDLERGRNVSFTTLAENNPFGNTNRFTDELGGQTYTKNIVIDWSTYNGSIVLGWRRTLAPSSNYTWNQSIDDCLLVSISPFTSGWRLPNRIEAISILNNSIATGRLLNYSPFNISSEFKFWVSTTLPNATTRAYYYNLSGLTGLEDSSLKSNNTDFRHIPCRTFTVTGTTLS
jgi:hypothetical protein